MKELSPKQKLNRVLKLYSDINTCQNRELLNNLLQEYYKLKEEIIDSLIKYPILVKQCEEFTHIIADFVNLRNVLEGEIIKLKSEISLDKLVFQLLKYLRKDIEEMLKNNPLFPFTEKPMDSLVDSA